MYDVSGGSGDRNCVVLNDIHIDIMDYIVPASCTDSEFRQMWAEFEWENKVKSPKSKVIPLALCFLSFTIGSEQLVQRALDYCCTES